MSSKCIHVVPTDDFSGLTLTRAGENKGKSSGAKGKTKGEPKGQASSKGKGQPIRTFCCDRSFLFVLVRAQDVHEAGISNHRSMVTCSCCTNCPRCLPIACPQIMITKNPYLEIRFEELEWPISFSAFWVCTYGTLKYGNSFWEMHFGVKIRCRSANKLPISWTTLKFILQLCCCLTSFLLARISLHKGQHSCVRLRIASMYRSHRSTDLFENFLPRGGQLQLHRPTTEFIEE